MKFKLFLFPFIIGCSSKTIEQDSKILVPNDSEVKLPQDNIQNPVPIPASISSSVSSSNEFHCWDTSDKCSIGEGCRQDSDCNHGFCNYKNLCVEQHSCTNHFGGDTCGSSENPSSQENCCKSLLVSGFTDLSHPSQKVYLDKYEVTAGRIRTWINSISKQLGKPDIKSWIPVTPNWNPEWNKFLPSDFEGNKLTINRLLLGDPRHLDDPNPGPGVIIPPATDQTVDLGINHQFGAQVFADLHGNNCGVFPGSYGFPTYYYTAEVLIKNAEAPRANGIGLNGENIPAQQTLDVKSMNCITNAMLAAFCIWDGGQLATSEVLDFITDSPPSLGNISGCGTQIDYHGVILDSSHVLPDPNIRTGGRCPDLNKINATFDAGGALPTIYLNGNELPDPLFNPGNFLNTNKYAFPDFPMSDTSQKVWQISAPGRIKEDTIKINPQDEGWMDLAGNLNEMVLETKNGKSTGKFGLKYRGIGYGSARSDLNMELMPGESTPRITRPEAKAAFSGGRCMRFK